jgi:hypothetical protein
MVSGFYSEKEKIEICVDIAKKLKFYENNQGITVNLFNENYTFIPKLKKIFADYIKDTKDYIGTLEFEEIGKVIEYNFPVSKKRKALFVIKIK